MSDEGPPRGTGSVFRTLRLSPTCVLPNRIGLAPINSGHFNADGSPRADCIRFYSK